VPALVLLVQVFFCPESPRWLLGKGRHRAAHASLLRLRQHRLLAARDLFQMATLLDVERRQQSGRNLLRELFAVGRNRRAAYASFVVMFGQQFCGVNAIAYYSSTVFTNAGFSDVSAIAASIGFGALKCAAPRCALRGRHADARSASSSRSRASSQSTASGGGRSSSSRSRSWASSCS
jgi:uncharacterized membrane protein YgcG